MCRSLPGRWPVPLLLLLCTGCASSSLQMLQEPPPYVSDIRSEYFTAYPDSPYRNDITVATVVPGMERFDVLAAWGHPERRVRNGVGVEEWTYLDLDSESGDAVEYDLVFMNGVLDRWSARPHKNTGMAFKGRYVPPKRVDTAEPQRGKRVPKT